MSLISTLYKIAGRNIIAVLTKNKQNAKTKVGTYRVDTKRNTVGIDRWICNS